MAEVTEERVVTEERLTIQLLRERISSLEQQLGALDRRMTRSHADLLNSIATLQDRLETASRVVGNLQRKLKHAEDRINESSAAEPVQS